jgi:cytochrome P450
MHRLAQRFTDVARELAEELAHQPMRWQNFNEAFQKMTRRVVFGDRAAGNAHLTDLLSELMSAGNKMPGEPAPGYDELIWMIEGYLKDPEPNSLAALIADAPAPADVTPAGQVVHWLFAMGDTLGANTFRTLAALSTHLEQQREVRADGRRRHTSAAGIASLTYLAGRLLEAMRLWPTTTLFGRVATRDVPFPSGAVLPEGTQVLIYNVFNHRNRDRIPYADCFSPGEWASGDAGDDWSYNFFSHGPQRWPGDGLSVFLARLCWPTCWTPARRQSREPA